MPASAFSGTGVADDTVVLAGRELRQLTGESIAIVAVDDRLRLPRLGAHELVAYRLASP